MRNGIPAHNLYEDEIREDIYEESPYLKNYVDYDDTHSPVIKKIMIIFLFTSL